MVSTTSLRSIEIESPTSKQSEEVSELTDSSSRTTNFFFYLNISLLSFTIDAWTSRNQLPFLGISVHWVDKVGTKVHHFRFLYFVRSSHRGNIIVDQDRNINSTNRKRYFCGH